MKKSYATTLLVIGALAGPIVAVAGGDSDMDRSAPKTFVKDSAITAKIKTKLAADHVMSLGRIHVDTDANGIVWLHGTARTEKAADRAVEIARETDGVKDVHSHIKVKKED